MSHQQMIIQPSLVLFTPGVCGIQINPRFMSCMTSTRRIWVMSTRDTLEQTKAAPLAHRKTAPIMAERRRPGTKIVRTRGKHIANVAVTALAKAQTPPSPILFLSGQSSVIVVLALL